MPTPVKLDDYAHLRGKRGPKNRYLSRAAGDLHISLSHLSLVARGLRKSPAVKAALEEWKRQNGIRA